jgi:hypothetical protein
MFDVTLRSSSTSAVVLTVEIAVGIVDGVAHQVPDSLELLLRHEAAWRELRLAPLGLDEVHEVVAHEAAIQEAIRARCMVSSPNHLSHC